MRPAFAAMGMRHTVGRPGVLCWLAAAFSTVWITPSPPDMKMAAIRSERTRRRQPRLRHQLRILSEFLKSLPLADMAPDATVVQHAAGVYAHALSAPSGRYAMYFDGRGPLAVTLDLPAGEYAAGWVDTQTGSVLKGQPIQHSGGPLTLQAPAFEDGIAFFLNRAYK